MQRVFDVENEKDMQDLWDILPESCRKITAGNLWDSICEYSDRFSYRSLLKINWHDKTEITRPVDYESMIGCVGWFWDNDINCKVLGILIKYDEEKPLFPFCRNTTVSFYSHFHPAKKSELKFWVEEE